MLKERSLREHKFTCSHTFYIPLWYFYNSLRGIWSAHYSNYAQGKNGERSYTRFITPMYLSRLFKGLWRDALFRLFIRKIANCEKERQTKRKELSSTKVSGRGIQWPQLHCYVGSPGHADTRVDAWRSVKTLFRDTSVGGSRHPTEPASTRLASRQWRHRHSRSARGERVTFDPLRVSRLGDTACPLRLFFTFSYHTGKEGNPGARVSREGHVR